MWAEHALPPVDPWLWMRTSGEVLAAGADPAGVGRRLRDARLESLLVTAASGSPLYRERLKGRSRPPIDAVEPVDKAQLMSRFDEWATDRRITRAGVERFLADPARLADAYLGDYVVWTSSGTTGEPGIFIQDARSLAAFDALDALRLRGGQPQLTPFAGWGAPPRCAFVAATGGHFAGVVSVERLRRHAASLWAASPFQWLAPTVRTFSVQDPLDDLARELQAFAPTVLITYPSCAAALAQRQRDGALALPLTEVWVGGEQLSREQRAQIAVGFGCVLRNNYGASEFYSMAWECEQGRLHLNDDWLIVEPVDRQLRPVPAGEASHSVLLTNLANHAQPLLRYRLDDSLRFVAGGCGCGSGFPVIEVQGRADDTLVLRDAKGLAVTLLPLALMTVIEEGAHVTQFQLVCTGAQTLELRFEAGQPAPAAAFERARTALLDDLAQRGLGNVRVRRGRGAPLRQEGSGKLRRVLAAACAGAQKVDR